MVNFFGGSYQSCTTTTGLLGVLYCQALLKWQEASMLPQEVKANEANKMNLGKDVQR